jgi:hypothetical protein
MCSGGLNHAAALLHCLELPGPGGGSRHAAVSSASRRPPASRTAATTKRRPVAHHKLPRERKNGTHLLKQVQQTAHGPVARAQVSSIQLGYQHCPAPHILPLPLHRDCRIAAAGRQEGGAGAQEESLGWA